MFLATLFLQTQMVSLDFEVGPIAGAVRKLSDVSGVPLSVEGVAKNDTVFIHVVNRPLKEVLDEIAKVTTSEWEPRGTGFALVRPPALIKLWQDREFQQKFDLVKKWQGQEVKTQREPLTGDLLAKYVAEYKEHIKVKSGYRSTDPAKYIEGALLMPLYLECRKRIDLSQIARLRSDKRVVFSSRPNARQVAFSQPIAPLIAELNAKLVQWRKSLDRAKVHAESVPVDPRRYEYAVFSNGYSNATLPFARPVNSVVLVCNATSYDTVRLTMTLVDNQGKVVAAMACGYLSLFQRQDPPGFILPEIESAVPLPMARSTGAFIEANQKGYRKNPTDLSEQEVTDALAPFFADPMKNDFLRLGNQEFLSMLGPKTKRSIVACLPDGQMMDWEETSVKRFVEAGIGEATSSSASDNWIEFFPRNPADHWRTRGSREALARCTKNWNEKHAMPMREVTQLFPGGDMGFPNILEFGQLAMPAARNRHSNSQIRYTNYAGMAKLLGSLTDNQLTLLTSGSMVRYPDLSKAQRSACESIVYGVPFHRVIGGNATSWEPTLELPRGLDENMGITAQVIDEKYLLAHDSEEQPSNDLRETMELDSRPERFNGAELGCGNYARANRWMKFEFRTRRRFALRVYLTKGHYYSVDYYDPMSPDKGQRLTVDQLPPTLVAKIKKLNPSFNSRIVVTTDKDGNRRGRTETYVEPNKKK